VLRLLVVLVLLVVVVLVMSCSFVFGAVAGRAPPLGVDRQTAEVLEGTFRKPRRRRKVSE
jgi:hypothetical protein